MKMKFTTKDMATPALHGLKKSVYGNSARLRIARNHRQVEVGTNMRYASVYQLGTRNAGRSGNITIPARPYVGLSTPDRQKISGHLTAYFRRLPV